MPNVINPNCLSLPQQVEKNAQDILKLFASSLGELSGLTFNPTSLVYEQGKAIVSGKFIIVRDETQTEINGLVTIPITSGDGIVVDASEDNTKIVISLDNEDRELLNFVEELISQIDEDNNIIFTSDMENYVTTNFSKLDATNLSEENITSWQKKLGGKVIWENANPTANFEAQTITLISGDYDFLIVESKDSINDTLYRETVVKKGNSFWISYVNTNTNVDYRYQIQERKYSFVSDISYEVGGNNYGRPNSYDTSRQDINIPIRIIGFKGVQNG